MLCNLKIGRPISFKALKNIKIEIQALISFLFLFLRQTQRLRHFRLMATLR